MDATFEQVFLAMAVKNGWIAKENAIRILTGYRSQQERREDLTLGDYLLETRVLEKSQIAELVEGTRQYVTQAAARMKSANGGDARAPQGPPEIVPGFRITGKLGVGGTATIFRAVPSNPAAGTREVALKILHPKKAADPKQRERFLREAELLKRFRHPNLVAGHDFGVHNGLHYAVMELVNGASVQDIIDREKRIEERRALEILVEVAQALEYMHQQGYVHKDIKPGNIMISADGKVKLCDLGFAQTMAAATPFASSAATQAEAGAADDGDGGGDDDDDEYTVGTVQFMSPEQAQGQRDVDIRSDIYSLGATLFYMVMGELPFQGENDMDTMAKHVLEELDSADMKNREISVHMHYFIERMMSKDKALRYETPAALVKDVKEQLEGFARLQQIQPARRVAPPPVSKPAPPARPVTKPVPPPAPRPRTGRLAQYTDKFRKKDLRRR